MHAMAGVYIVLVIWLQLIMALNADVGMATFTTVEMKMENTCGDDILIGKQSAIVPRRAWEKYGGCGAYFKITCVNGKEDCAIEGASITVQAIDFVDSLKEELTLSFEAFDLIAATTSTLVKIQYTKVTGLGDTILDDESDSDYSDDLTMTDVIDNGLEDVIMDDITTNAEDGWAVFDVIEIVDLYCDDDVINDGLSAIVSKSIWIKYRGCGALFKVTCVKGNEDCAKEGASVTVKAVDYTDYDYDNHIILAFEAFDTIAKSTSTLIQIKFTNLGLGNGIVAGASDEVAGARDEVAEDVIMADTK